MTILQKVFRTRRLPNGVELWEPDEPAGGSVPGDYTDVLGTTGIQFPHCDSLVLHSPGACEFCDRHPDWQALRSAQGVAFSDMAEADVERHGLVPCPSTTRRPAEVRDRWGGNRPYRA